MATERNRQGWLVVERMNKQSRYGGSQGGYSLERRRPVGVMRTGWHAFWPGRPRVLKPAAQAVHCLLPVEAAKVLTGQAVHRRAPSLAE